MNEPSGPPYSRELAEKLRRDDRTNEQVWGGGGLNG